MFLLYFTILKLSKCWTANHFLNNLFYKKGCLSLYLLLSAWREKFVIGAKKKLGTFKDGNVM